MFNYILNNKEWIFSGIGVAIILLNNEIFNELFYPEEVYKNIEGYRKRSK